LVVTATGTGGLAELQEKWHFTSLEKIFFEEKIYKELEKKHENWEKVLLAIARAFEPFRKQMQEILIHYLFHAISRAPD